MAVDERRRSRLFQRLSSALGPDEAATMFELPPPPATTRALVAGALTAVVSIAGLSASFNAVF